MLPVSRRLKFARICSAPKYESTDFTSIPWCMVGLCTRSVMTHGRHRCRSPAGTQRTNIRNPGWSPTTVMCPLQGEVSSNRNTLPGGSRLVSPSVDDFTMVIDNEYGWPPLLERIAKRYEVGTECVVLAHGTSMVKTGRMAAGRGCCRDIRYSCGR